MSAKAPSPVIHYLNDRKPHKLLWTRVTGCGTHTHTNTSPEIYTDSSLTVICWCDVTTSPPSLTHSPTSGSEIIPLQISLITHITSSTTVVIIKRLLDQPISNIFNLGIYLYMYCLFQGISTKKLFHFTFSISMNSCGSFAFLRTECNILDQVPSHFPMFNPSLQL